MHLNQLNFIVEANKQENKPAGFYAVKYHKFVTRKKTSESKTSVQPFKTFHSNGPSQNKHVCHTRCSYMVHPIHLQYVCPTFCPLSSTPLILNPTKSNELITEGRHLVKSWNNLTVTLIIFT